MIRGFRGKFAEAILRERLAPKGFPADLAAVARRKLIMVNNAAQCGAECTAPPIEDRNG